MHLFYRIYKTQRQPNFKNGYSVKHFFKDKEIVNKHMKCCSR